MKKAILLALVVIFSHCTKVDDQKNSNMAKNPVFEFGKLNPNAPKETGDWAQLIGEWKCISKDLSSDNKWIENNANWRWKYTLNGYAIQDYWYQEINDADSKMKAFYGTNIRIYNPKKEHWEISWINNRSMQVSPTFFAKRYDDNIIMNDEKNTMEITFYKVKKNSFTWKAELINKDSSRTLVSEIDATRMR